MPERTKATAREVLAKVVKELMEKLESRTAETIRGAIDRRRRTRRPRHSDNDWPRTIARNLRHWQAEHRTIVPETLIGHGRMSKGTNLEEVFLCVDQSGSMGTSVVYSSIFAAVMASLPAISTKLIVFDTNIFDLTEELSDPVEVLFSVQLGGATDINQALTYCERLVAEPARTHLALISDLIEGGIAEQILARARSMVGAGVNMIMLLALNGDGGPTYDAHHAAIPASLGCPVFACTPHQFPDLMAAALKRQDMWAWEAEREIKLVRGHQVE